MSTNGTKLNHINVTHLACCVYSGRNAEAALDDAGAFTGHAAERVPAGNRPQHQFADGESRYTDLLVDLLLLLLLLRRNLGRRLVKSPKVYVRDSGLLHALLSVPSMTALNDHPIVDPSWEGFVIENLIKCAPPWTQPFYHCTSVGAEIDLLFGAAGR